MIRLAARAAINDLMETTTLRAVAISTDGCLGLGAIEVAFSEVKRNLVQRALFPLLGFCQPENSSFGIQQSTLATHRLLATNFDEPVHELHSCGVKPVYTHTLAES
jgi:hypothetical protein